MRDDFQIPNMGEAPNLYDVRFFSRMVRNIELTFTALRTVGKVAATVVAYRPVTVAALPSLAQPGWTAYASDGRKNGEGAGAGTGVMVFYDGTNWCACDTGQPVSA